MFVDPYQIRRAIRDGISITAGGAVQLSAGTTSSARSDFTFSNSPSVTFGLNGAGVITASVAPAAGGLTNIKVSAGTLSQLRSDITFNNSNGVSFGLAAGVITATVATNYQSAGAYLTTAQPPGAYLTTAMASNRGTDFVQANATFFGTNASGTIASNGISVSVAAPGGGGAGTGFTTASTAGTDIVGTLNTAGLSMGVPAYLTTASILFAAQGVSNLLTGILFLDSNNVTFGLSGDIYTASAAINVSASGGSALVSAITFDNSNNVTFGYDGTNITASIATTYAGTGITTATTAGTAVVGTLNTSGLSLGIPAYLTTAAVSGAISALNISAGSTSSNVGAVTFSNGSGVTFGYDGTNVTASVQTNYQTPGAYLTTAQPVGVYAGTGFTSTTTGGTNIVATLNTSGLSMGIPAYLTTAAAAGLSNIKVSAGTLSALRSDITFANSNSVSFGLNSLGVITASVNPDPAIQISAGTTSTERQDFTFINSNNITFGLGTGASAGHITASFADGDTWAGTNTSVITTAGSDLSFAVNTSGVTIAYPKWLTTAAAAGLSAINIEAGTTSTNASAFTFSNANSISFGLGTGASAGVITAAFADHGVWAGTNTSVATIAGSDLTCAVNTSGVTIGYPKWLTTAAVPTPLSYFANFPLSASAFASTAAESSDWYVFPITVPAPLSVSYIRLFGSGNFSSTTIATSAVNNATGASTTFQRVKQFNVIFYTVGNGANSRSLQYVTSASAGFTWAVSVSQASTSNASRCSITQAITYPSEGFTTANTTVQYSVSATNSPISTTQWSDFTSYVFLDIPFDASLNAGNYWVACNAFNSTTGAKQNNYMVTTLGFSNVSNAWKNLGSTTAATAGPFIGLGWWPNIAGVAATSASIPMSSIFRTTSYVIPAIQFIRQS